jgi:hypothetical protein
MVTWNKHDLYAFQVKQGMKKDLGAGSNSEASLRKDETDKKASIQGLSAVNQHPEKFKLNKTETRWLGELQLRRKYLGEEQKWGEIRPQAITLELGEGCRYRPDFSVVINGKLTFWEVKGAWLYPEGIVKFKVAPRIWPEFDFYLAQWKDGKWTETKLLP